MAPYYKFEPGIQAIFNKELDLFGTSDTLKLAIHSDAPTLATDDELADLTQITGTGYTAGGEDTQNDSTRSGGTVTMTGVDIVWTAGASDWDAGRYFALYDDTSTGDKLLGGWDYGENFALLSGETITAGFGSAIMTGA